MKKPINHPYEKFNKALLKTVSSKERYSGLVFSNVDEVNKVWNSMSPRSKGKLVADSRWNHYPIRSYTKHKRRFGVVIGSIVEAAQNAGEKESLLPLINKAEGVFAIYMLDSSPSSVRIKMAKRLKKSPDYRVRTRCAKILPVNYLKEMLEDKHYSVRSIALQRLGHDNCYKEFIPNSILASKSGQSSWYSSWLERKSVTLSERSELAHLIEELSSVGEEDDLKFGKFYKGLIVAELIKKLSPEEALYHMDLREKSHYIDRALKLKLGQ